MNKRKLVLGVALAAGFSVGLHGAVPRALADTRDGLGDPLPGGALARLGSGRFRHPGGVYGLVFSRDGQVLASTGGGSTVFFWDAATGRRRLQFDADPSGESVAAVSVDGKVATEVLVDTGTFRVRDAATGQVLHELKGDTQGSLLSLAFSADGKRLASSGVGRVIRVWDLAAGKEVRHWEVQLPDGVQPLRFSPDGNTLVGVDRHGRGAIHFWDLATGREPFPALAHQETISALTFSGDGRVLASSGGDQQVRLWDTATGKELRHFGKPSQMMALAFSPDGRTLASGDMEGGLYLWDVATGKPRLEMAGHRGSVRRDCERSEARALAFSPDGKVLASGGSEGDIRLWDPAGGKELLASRGHTGAVSFVALGPDGQAAVSLGWDRHARVWDLGSGKERRRIPVQDHLTRAPLALSPDGSVLAVGTVHGIVELWDLTTGKQRQLQSAETVFGDRRGPAGTAGFAICSPAFSPDGKTLALLGGWGDAPALCLWDVATGEQPRWIECPAGWSGCLAFAPDGKTVASTVCSPQTERVRHDNYPQDRIYLWDVATAKEVRHLDGHKGGARALALSPDGRALASCGEMDYTVRLWDVVTGLEMHHVGGELPRLTATPDGKHRYTGECDVLYCTAFSPDGKSLAVGGKVGLRLHEAATGKERYRFADAGCDVTSVAFSADGRVVISGQADGTVLLWDAHAGQGAGPGGKPGRGDLPALWADLAGDDAVRAFRAVGRLAAVPEQAVPFLAERLTAALKADPARVARLIQDLDSDEFAVRDQASAELALLGKQAEPALREALESKPSTEVETRVKVLLRRLEGPGPAGDRLLVLRTVEVLERVGTAEARQALQAFTKGSPETAREARLALGRLGRRR